MRNLLPVLLALAGLLALGVRLPADPHPNAERGFSAEKAYHLGEIDHVNLFNGNLVLTLAVGPSYPVHGSLSYGLTLTYNSQLWDFEEDCLGTTCSSRAYPDRRSNAGLGWRLSMGQLLSWNDGTNSCGNWCYLGPDGAEHVFYNTLHPTDPDEPGDGSHPSQQRTLYTRDGSYLRLTIGPGTNQLEFPSGEIHTFDASGELIQIHDRFLDLPQQRNRIVLQRIASSPPRLEISDGHGRVQRIVFRTDLPEYVEVVDRVELSGFGGAPSVYRFSYQTVFLPRAQPHSDHPSLPALPNPVAVPLLTRIERPDGSTFEMSLADYHTDGSAGGNRQGLLRGVRLPTYGRIEWTYTPYAFPTGAGRAPWRDTSIGVATRTLRSETGAEIGTWQYRPSLTPLSPGESLPLKETVRTVISPLGDKTESFFSVYPTAASAAGWNYGDYGLPFTRHASASGRFLSSRVYDCSPGVPDPVGCQLRRSTYVLYERDFFTSPSTVADDPNLNRRSVSESTVFHDDDNRFIEESRWGFDGYGHYRSRVTGGNLPGNNVRLESTGYNPARGTYGQPDFSPWPASAPWLLNLYDSAWESEGAQLLYRSFCFEESTGFLRARRVHAANDPTYRSNDLVEVFDRDVYGNVTGERYYGGDTQAVSTGWPGGLPCRLAAGLSPAAAQYQVSHSYASGARSRSEVSAGGAILRTLDLSIDNATGLASLSRDPAGVQTAYSYDALWRQTRLEPSGEAPTTYAYTPATGSTGARVTVSRSNSGIPYHFERFTFDALGRLFDRELRLPDSSLARSRTAFNALGWKTYESEPGSVASGTTYLGHDPFGRPATIRPADGSAHDVDLTYRGIREVTRRQRVATGPIAEVSVFTTEQYDRFGRLYEVTEPNGVKTRYEYDAGNRLTRVCQGATGSGTANCGQVRQLAYDNRGFLLWENHPEKTANILGLGHDVDYAGYDARGHATRKVDGASDLTFTYDKAERLVEVRETLGRQRVLKSFTYAGANGFVPGVGTDFKAGKLVSASRFNLIGAPFLLPDGSESTAEVRETYVYAGRGGRVSQKETQLFFNGAARERFSQSFVYGEDGLLTSQAYPQCTANCSGDGPRTQTYTYSYGRPTALPGFASAVTYHPNGLWATVRRTNGLTDRQSNDPNGLRRPQEIFATRDADGLGMWTTGLYRYDGSGNVWKAGSAAYEYDSLSRLTRGTVFPGAHGGGTAHTQSYTYDDYGNITGITTQGSLVVTPTTVATNRLSAASYDAAGNLTAWSGNGYEYDAFHQMRRYVTGAEDWRYLYTAGDERFWSYRTGGNGSLWTLRDLDSQLLREYQSHLGWAHYRDYVYREGALLASATSPAAGNAVTHLHADHLGTPRLVTDATGNPATASFHTYYPFGQEIAGTFSTAYTDRLRFTGHERDLLNPAGQGDDLDYMHARHYSPVHGRFLSTDRADIISLQFGDAQDRNRLLEFQRQPQGWNRFGYTKGNPLKYVDPNGESAVLAIPNAIGLSGAAGAGLGAATGTAGVVILAGGAGYVLGAEINKVPGVSETIQKGFGAVFDLLIFAQNTKHNRNIANGNIAQALGHLVKISDAGGPGRDPDFKHHQKEIKNFLESALKAAKRLPGKLRDEYLKTIDAIAKRAGVRL